MCRPPLAWGFGKRGRRQRQRARRVRDSARGVNCPSPASCICAVSCPDRLGSRRLTTMSASCRIASPTAMAAAIATLSERKPFRIGMTSRASAAAAPARARPRNSRPNSSMSPAPEGVVEIGWRGACGEQDQPRGLGAAPGFERLPAGVARDVHLIEIVHAGAAECAIGGREAGGLDDVRLEAEAGGEAQDRPGILGNVGLNSAMRMVKLAVSRRFRQRGQLARINPTSKGFVACADLRAVCGTAPLALPWQGCQ